MKSLNEITADALAAIRSIDRMDWLEPSDIHILEGHIRTATLNAQIQLAKTVLTMRVAQSIYFKTRSQTELQNAKAAEAEVDGALRTILSQAP